VIDPSLDLGQRLRHGPVVQDVMHARNGPPTSRHVF
jgi:hypothetical protein